MGTRRDGSPYSPNPSPEYSSLLYTILPVNAPCSSMDQRIPLHGRRQNGLLLRRREETRRCLRYQTRHFVCRARYHSIYSASGRRRPRIYGRRTKPHHPNRIKCVHGWNWTTGAIYLVLCWSYYYLPSQNGS